MPKQTARLAFLRVIDPTNASTNLTTSLGTINLSQKAENPEINTFGNTNKQRMFDGIKDWELTFDGYWESGAGLLDDTLFPLLGGSCMIDYGPSGSTSGCIKYSGCAILSDYTMNFTIEDAAQVSGTFVARTGSLTMGGF